MIKATGAEILVNLLKRQGIHTVAGIPGGSILPIYDELNKKGLNHILVRSEQGAGFLAQGMARSSGLPAVCFATSGPGAMNLLTPVADARADSVPLIAITGQVARDLIGTDAFQEADTFGLSLPITKHSVLVSSAKELLDVVPKAFSIAMSGRPGPVLIDIPVDVQTEVVEFIEWPSPGQYERKAARFRTEGSELVTRIKQFSDILLSAQHPVLFAGGGCNSIECSNAIQKFLKVFPLPVVTSLMGLCTIPHDHDCFLGMTGIYGFKNANEVLFNADVVLAAGVRFDERSSGKLSLINKNAKILHIDIDAAEINKLVDSFISIVSDTESVFPVLTEYMSSQLLNGQKRLSDGYKKVSATSQVQTLSLGAQLIQKVAKAAEISSIDISNLIITADVGLHQMWVAQGFPFSCAGQFLTSGSLGTMGFALPAAIGAALSNPDKRVLCITGDGSIMMNLQELATLNELNLNVTIIVIDNDSLGMVREQQRKLYKNRYSASSYTKPSDVALIAEAFGISSRHIDKDASLQILSDSIFPKISDGARLISIQVPQNWE